MKKKDFSAPLPSERHEKLVDQSSLRSKPRQTKIFFPDNAFTCRSFDFGPYYGCGFDSVTSATQKTIESLLTESLRTKGKTLSVATIISYCRIGLRQFYNFLPLWRSTVETDLAMEDITRETIKRYLNHLRNSDTQPGTQKNSYSSTKSVLVACHRHGCWPSVDIKTVFPSNPFPNSNRLVKGQKALTKKERSNLIRALSQEMKGIVNRTDQLNSYDLAVCVLAIGLSTGMNPTPLLELRIDCIQPHPLKEDQRLLVSFKRRGNATQIMSLRLSQEIAALASIRLQAANAIEIIIERNADIRSRFHDPGHLLVFEGSGKHRGVISRLSLDYFHELSQQLVQRHALVDDTGKPLVLNMSRLRKTLLNRVWEMSGQDPLLVARTGRHSPQTGNNHYWEAPPEAERNMRFLGEIRVKELLDNKMEPITAINTPIAACRDPKYGQRAPKDGSVCTELLGCFRCKSFVVTEDDLYRLFSFYWAVVRHHSEFGGKRWKKYLRQVIRIIDENIGSQFDAATVKRQRDYAQNDPHPFWKDLTMARMAK